MTLAHELGHLIMHQAPSPDMEKEAYAFASALLMPREDIYNHLVNINRDLGKLASLKMHWKVSMQALAKRASDLNAITEFNYKRIMMQFSSNHWRIQEPITLDVSPDEPETIKQILTLHFQELDYSVDELADLVCMKPKELKEFFDIIDKEENKPIPKLRLVK